MYTNPSQTRGFSYLVAVKSQNDLLVLKVGSKLAVSKFAVPNFSVPKTFGEISVHGTGSILVSRSALAKNYKFLFCINFVFKEKNASNG